MLIDRRLPRGYEGWPDACISARLHFLEPRPPGVQALVKSRAECRFRCDNLYRLETRDAREQIEVCGEEAVGIGNPIGDGDHDVPDRRIRGLRDQLVAKPMLIAMAAGDHTSFVLAECVGEKRGLLQQAIRTAIAPRRAAKRFFDELFEAFHTL